MQLGRFTAAFPSFASFFLLLRAMPCKCVNSWLFNRKSSHTPCVISLLAHQTSCTSFFRCLVFFGHEFETQVAVAADENDATTNLVNFGTE